MNELSAPEVPIPKQMGRLRRWWIYFRRGHNILVLGIWTVANTTIIYVLLGNEMPLIYALFTSILIFAVVLWPIYFTAATILGRWDFKKGTYPTEAVIAFTNNPEWNKKWDALMSDLQGVEIDVRVIKGTLFVLREDVNKMVKVLEEAFSIDAEETVV